MLTIKIRLLVASVDKAREIGMDWWLNDPYYSSHANYLEKENKRLSEQVNRLEQLIEGKNDVLQEPVKSQNEPTLNNDHFINDTCNRNKTGL